MAMMPTSGNTHTYITQWLQVATKGKVGVEFALIADRCRFRCFECGQTLTTPTPDGSTIDFGIQEFVKLHCHTGGYESPKPLKPQPLISPIPLTADFKKIDDKPAVAAKIIEQVDKFAKDYADKLLDENIVKKIQELQSESVGNPPEVPVKPEPEWGDPVPATDFEVEQLEKELAKKRALENALKIKLLQKQIEELSTKQAGYVPVAPPKHEAPLTYPEGRKFR